MSRTTLVFRAVILAASLSLAGSGVVAQQGAQGRWIAAWGASQNGLAMSPLSNTTVRMMARVTIGGDAIRIRLDNTYGTTPLVVGKAYVGSPGLGAALVAGSNRQVTFGKSASVTVPAEGTVTSDPVQIRVLPGQDLAVSLFIPETNIRASQHSDAAVTSYMTPDGAGDKTLEGAAAPFSRTTTSMYWLKAIDVLSSMSTGAIIAFGDSITDGTCSTLDAHDRWVDWLATRLQLQAQNRDAPAGHKAVVNEGIGGNTVTRENLSPPPNSAPALERLDRDVLSHAGATHVIFFVGTNDVRRDAPAAQVIAGHQKIIERVKAKGLKIIGVTIIPRHDNTGWDAEKTRRRNEVNQWIRTKAPYDAVIDFDKVVQDKTNLNLIHAPYNCDGTHPTPIGYAQMGKSIPLNLFE